MEELNYADVPSIDILPDDCLIHIFTFLPIPDRLRIERASKRWQSLTKLSWRRIKTLRLDDAFHRYVKDTNKYDSIDVDVKALQKVLKLCGPYLTCIDFDHDCIKSNESILSNIHTLCPKVEKISLSEFCKDSTVKAVMHNFTKLRSFQAECIDCAEEDLFAKLFDNSQKLCTLKLVECELQARSFSHLNHEALEHLRFSRNGIDSMEILLNEIKKFNNLRSLEYEGDEEDIFDSDVANAVLKAVPSNKLKSLMITVTFDQNRTPQEDVRLHISRFQNLDELVIRVNPEDKIFDDKTLHAIARSCVKLTKLRIFGAKAITDVGFTWVAKLLPIESLTLGRVNFSGKALSYMKSLKELFCYFCPHISNEGLTTLIETSQKIRWIELINCQVINPKGLIGSFKKSPRRYLLVHNCSRIGSDKRSNERCIIRKVDNQLRMNVQSNCGSSFDRRTTCADDCSTCSKQEFIHYI